MSAIHQHPARLPDRARPKRAPARFVVPMSSGTPAMQIGAAASPVGTPKKLGRSLKCRPLAHKRGVSGSGANRKTAAATAQVQRPSASPSAAAVRDRLSMMRLLVS